MHEGSVVNLTFPFTLADRIKAGLTMIIQSWARIAWVAIFPALGATLLFLDLISSDVVPLIDWFLVIALFLFMPVMILINSVIAHRAQRRLLKTHTYNFSPDGLQVLTETTELKQSWKAIQKVKKQNGFLLLFFSKKGAHCIPLRAVPDHANIDRILEFAKAAGVLVHG